MAGKEPEKAWGRGSWSRQSTFSGVMSCWLGSQAGLRAKPARALFCCSFFFFFFAFCSESWASKPFSQAQRPHGLCSGPWVCSPLGEEEAGDPQHCKQAGCGLQGLRQPPRPLTELGAAGIRGWEGSQAAGRMSVCLSVCTRPLQPVAQSWHTAAAPHAMCPGSWTPWSTSSLLGKPPSEF